MDFYYLIAIGSNLGNRSDAIARALALLGQQVGEVVAVSRFYETDPIGHADLPFINAACLLRSSLQPLPLMMTLLSVEAEMGRVRSVRWGNRIIDLDIIMAKDADGQEPVLLQGEGLTLPHPRCLERDFVVVPAADVCPDWIVPGQTQTFAELSHSMRSKMVQPKPV